MTNLDQLEKDVKKGIVSSKILTSRFKFIDESNKKSVAYNDPFYIPFFYYLGKYISPVNFFELGFDLGLTSSCFLKSCKTVEYFLGFQKKTKDFYNDGLGKSNLRINYKKNFDVYYGDFFDKDFSTFFDKKNFDLMVINSQDEYDKLFSIAESLYLKLKDKGYLVFNNLNINKNKEIFMNIATGYKKEHRFFGSKYPVGILQK